MDVCACDQKWIYVMFVCTREILDCISHSTPESHPDKRKKEEIAPISVWWYVQCYLHVVVCGWRSHVWPIHPPHVDFLSIHWLLGPLCNSLELQQWKMSHWHVILSRTDCSIIVCEYRRELSRDRGRKTRRIMPWFSAENHWLSSNHLHNNIVFFNILSDA